MKLRLPVALALVLGALFAWSTVCVVEAGQVSKKPAIAPVDAAGPLTILKGTPKIARVRFDVSPGGAAITHDLVFPKDGLQVATASGDPSIFVAFTGQQRPLAIEAYQHKLGDNDTLVEDGATTLVIVDVAVRPASAAVILGPPKGAGHVVKLLRANAGFGVRIRSAIPLELPAKPTSVTLMARLGVREGLPMPLGLIEVGGMLGATIRGARATLCGPTSDPRPLTLTFPGYPPSKVDAGTISSNVVTRNDTDDLCVEILT